jgi:hypothetical protein
LCKHKKTKSKTKTIKQNKSENQFHSKMSGSEQSTRKENNDEMKILSNIDDDILLRSQRSMPLLVIRVPSLNYVEDIPSIVDVPEYSKMVNQSIDLDFNCLTDYLQAPRWQQQVLDEIRSTHDGIDEMDAFEEPEYGNEDFLDSDSDYESDCSDDIDDSIRLTKCRLYKNKKSGPGRLNNGIVGEPRLE